MSYTIKYALNVRDCDRIIDLVKNGNEYIVTRWNKKEHRTERYYTTERLSMAEAVFVLWCDNWGATDIIETEQTWNATDFD